jgi:hypothetical protein
MQCEDVSPLPLHPVALQIGALGTLVCVEIKPQTLALPSLTIAQLLKQPDPSNPASSSQTSRRRLKLSRIEPTNVSSCQCHQSQGQSAHHLMPSFGPRCHLRTLHRSDCIGTTRDLWTGRDTELWKHNPDKFNWGLERVNTTKDNLHLILRLS